MQFTENTRLCKIVNTKQFKLFKKYIIAPREYRGVMGIYRLKDLCKFYNFNPVESATTLNYMVDMVDKGKLSYTPFDKKDVGIYSFIIGDNKPFVLILPGGAYKDVCSLIEGYSTARIFNQLGFNVFIGNYSVGKLGIIPNPQDDVAQMLNWIMANGKAFNIDTTNYAICGFSAGGHLAATWGLEEIGYKNYNLPKPNLEILCYPVITMSSKTESNSRNNLLGKFKTDEKIQQKYSVELMANSDYPKTFLWQCDGDKLKDSILLHDKLTKVGVEHVYKVYSGGAHGVGVGIGTPAEGWVQSAVNFWQEIKNESNKS